MTHEQIAKRNIKGAFNWIVGGYYNSLQDGYVEDLPESRDSLKDEIYEASMNNFYAPGLEVSGKAPKEMRFAGKDFCTHVIEDLLDTDSDVKEISKEAGWDKQKATWEAFVIRKTYLEGSHKGESFIYIKGGYVKDDNPSTFIFEDECYFRRSTAKSVATRYLKQQEDSIRCNRIVGQRASYEVVDVVNGHLIQDDQNRYK